MKVFPGQKIDTTHKFLAGKNTYERGSDIVSTVFGTYSKDQTGTKDLKQINVTPTFKKGPAITIDTIVVCKVI